MTGLMTKMLIFNLAFMRRISSLGHISMTQTQSRKEMLTLKQRETVRETYGACRMIGSAKSLRRSKHMLRQITPKSSTGPSMRFTTDSLQQALLR